MGEFYVTETWIRAHSTKNAGWTEPQLRVLGVPWPPPRGWLRRLVGTAITQAQRVGFEALHAEQQAKLRKRG